MYFDYFDGAFYINLDRRTDRCEAFEKRASDMGLSIPRFSAVELDQDDPRLTDEMKKDSRCRFKIGCNLSHMSVIKTAKDNGWKNVLIFEDDCIFLPNFVEKVSLCVKELIGKEWDLFYMGGEPNVECIPFSENLRVVPLTGGVYETHAYAVNSSFYERILRSDLIQSAAIDVIYLHLDKRTYVLSKELLAIQDNSESDLWGGRINRYELCKLAYNRYVK